MNKHNKLLLVLSVLTAALLVAAACGPAPTAEPTKPPAATATTAPAPPTVTPVPVTKGTCGTLRLLWWQAPTILNPHLATGSKDFDAARPVYEPLAALNEKGEPDVRYGLAAEVPTLQNGGISPDGLSVTWKLKTGVKWSDGTPFTADDVVFTWRYVTDKATAATSSMKMVEIKAVEKVDDYTVKITWKQPNPVPYIAFTGMYGMVIQKKAFENFMGEKARDAPANFKPVGTGPYMVKEFKPDDVVIYELNPHFRDPNKPCFKEVVLKGGGDATSAARAVLQTGDADYAWNLQVEADVLQELSKGGKGVLVSVPGGNIERIVVNFTNPDPALGDKRSEPGNPHPFLSDLKVRRALALATDRQTIAKALYGDGLLGVAACNILATPPALVSTTKFDTCEFNLEKANKLLDEAGWVKGPDGIRQKVVDGKIIKMKILFSTTVTPVRQKTQEIVKQGWEKLGIQVELKAVQGGVFFSGDVANPDTYRKFFADVEMFGNKPSAPDDPMYMGGWTCAEIKTKAANWTGQNIGRWCNPDYDKLFGELGKTLDPAKRAALYKQMNDMVVDDVAVIPLIEKAYPVIAHSKALKGIVTHSWDSDLWDLVDWTNK
ncbi:MAG: peptide ABC transporter substrate-binding protein [Chloroflexi bacterium]|nr:peptide ABC transporter substrate-binding protein [Chloroflexota bacterium]